MDTFTGVRKADLARHGRYRTKEAILACYDRMAAGRYRTAISPPPGQGPRHPAGPPGGGR